jgi:hypothetical protein
MFLCICSDATHRAQRGKELRQEERSFVTEQNPFSVRHASRTPQPMAFCTPSRAIARPRVQCFLFFAFTPSPLLQLLLLQLVTEEKTVKAR